MGLHTFIGRYQISRTPIEKKNSHIKALLLRYGCFKYDYFCATYNIERLRFPFQTALSLLFGGYC